MKIRFSLACCLLLAGCTDTDWDHVLNYGGAEEEQAPVTVARPAPQPEPAAMASAPGAPAEPANAAFCRSVATQDASGNGFDQPTQQRVFTQSYSQCVAIYAR